MRKGLIRHIGISNMTIPKLEAVLPLMEIMPSACESEMHVCFQQKEIFDYLDGKCSLDEAVSLIQQNSRHYAMRQLTWWRRDPSIHWMEI